MSHTHTLIPNPDPKIRILLHRATEPAVSAYVTVEEDETDAIGGHQWKIVDDGRTERVRAIGALALIEYAKPGAVAARAPMMIGACQYDGHRYRCSVHRSDADEIVLVTEIEDRDQAGAPRWNSHATDRITERDGAARRGWIDVDILAECVHPQG